MMKHEVERLKYKKIFNNNHNESTIPYLNNGMPKPMMKNAKIMDDISVTGPNAPDIMDCNILSVTLRIVIAPRLPIET